MKDTLKQLVANGFDAYQVTLQQIRCKDGSAVYAYSTYKPQAKANFFGNNAVNATCSVLDTSQPRVDTTYSTKLVTVWLNDCDAETYELYRAECGPVAIAIVSTNADGSFSVDLHTKDTAHALLPQDVPASAHASV